MKDKKFRQLRYVTKILGHFMFKDVRGWELTDESNKVYCQKKLSFLLRISLVNMTNPQFSADLVTFTEEIFNRKLHF